MEWLNYHHLLYFWTVASEGSVARAADKLGLAQPTISGQIRSLEEQMGERLFQRAGRHLVLTQVGRLVFRYADEIFTLGRELQDTLKDRPTGRPLRFQVGVAQELSKSIAHRILEPALGMDRPVQLVCREGPVDRLLADLATHHLDLVLADAPIPPTVRVKAFSHALGESTVSVFGAPKLVAGLKRGFPSSLREAPWLLPSDQTTMRRALDSWFAGQQIRPRVAAEFDDSALLKTFGQAGTGVFAAPTVIEEEICRHYRVQVAGRLDGVRERFFAISAERRLKHPAVIAISEAAHTFLKPAVPRKA